MSDTFSINPIVSKIIVHGKGYIVVTLQEAIPTPNFAILICDSESVIELYLAHGLEYTQGTKDFIINFFDLQTHSTIKNYRVRVSSASGVTN